MKRRDEERWECPFKSGEGGTEKEAGVGGGGERTEKHTVEETWATVREGLGEGYWKG